jgi:hypothetical protein
MSHRNATQCSTGTATGITLAALLAGGVAGIPAALYGITRDWAVTGQTILLAAVVVAIAVDLLWVASSARCLLRLHRRQS